jgi:acyl carrier protein
VAQAGAAGDARLVAYCVVDGGLGASELHTHLEHWVPEFMLPAAIVILDALPLTASGKVDRLALPDPVSPSEAAEDYLAPRSPMEQAVAAIWSRVLGVERIGVHEDFFALGGHSLLATQVVAHVRSDFSVDLPLHSLFSYPTVESLTAEIVNMIGDSDHDETVRLLAELESLSEEDAQRLLAGDESGAS